MTVLAHMFVKQYVPSDWHIKWCKDVVPVLMQCMTQFSSVLVKLVKHHLLLSSVPEAGDA